jgi:hypothetical protein
MLTRGFVAEGYGPGPVPTAMCSPSSAGVSAPVCVPTATDTSPFVGTAITLFANCTGNPTSFTWTGCSSSGGRCDAISNVPGTVTYSVAGTNAGGTGNAGSIDVHWRSLPTAPVCAMTVTSNTTPPVVGSTALLTAACTNAPTSYNWFNCSSGATSCAAQANGPGVQNYSVSGSNAGGTGPAAMRAVNWVSSAPAAPGLCSQYPSYLFSDLGWADTQLFSRDFTDPPGFAWNGVWVIKVSVPANASGGGQFSIAEFAGPPTAREVTVSRVPCDFRPDDPNGNNGPFARGEGINVAKSFVIGAPSGGKLGLAAGVDYYVNIRNWDAASSQISCDSSIRCEALFFISVP